MKKIFTFCLTMILLFVMSSCTTGTTTTTITYGTNPNDIKLEDPSGDYKLFTSKDEIIEFFETSVSNYGNLRDYAKNNGDEYVDAEPAASDDLSPEESYQTNTQVAGVDEADIVKVKDDIICYLAYGENGQYVLYLLKEVDGSLKQINTVYFKEETTLTKQENNAVIEHITSYYPRELYLTDRYVVLCLSTYEYDRCTLQENNNKSVSSANYKYSTSYKLYDINTLKEVKTIKTAGSNVSTRLIGNTLYVINNYTEFTSKHLLPYYAIDDEYFETTADHVVYCPSYHNVYYFISIYKITLNEEIEVNNTHILSPYINNIYANKDNTYLIRTWGSTTVREDDVQYSYSTSKVVVIQNETLKVLGDFTTIGNIQDQYWIDEYNGYIRCVTTGSYYSTKILFNDFYFCGESKIFNYLTIYKIKDDGIEHVTTITSGIGKPNESIRSARFNGNVLTVVTFENIDPIYYIDLTNPEKPVITSALEISGYSIYQLPYKDHYVIGFGYEVANNRTIGYKITLFDTSDQVMKVVGKPFVKLYNTDNRSYYYPDFLSNPKALLVNLNRDLFGYHESEYHYGNNYYYVSSYRVFKINLEKDCPFEEIVYEQAKSSGYNSYIYEKYQRMVFIKNNYYLLSYDDVICYKYVDGKLVKQSTMLLK